MSHFVRQKASADGVRRKKIKKTQKKLDNEIKDPYFIRLQTKHRNSSENVL